MRLSLLFAFPIFLFAAIPAHALDFWHSSTVWAGFGQCSAQFTFDSGLEEFKSLQVSINAVDRAGKAVASGVLEIKDFGSSSATRYAEDFLEGEEVCAEGLTIVVTKATAMVNGKRVDLLKTKGLSARDFKPFRIRIGK